MIEVDADRYVVHMHEYVSVTDSLGNDNTRSTPHKTIFEGTHEQCVNWVKAKALELMLTIVDGDLLGTQEVRFEKEDLLFTRTESGPGEYYRYDCTSYHVDHWKSWLDD